MLKEQKIPGGMGLARRVDCHLLGQANLGHLLGGGLEMVCGFR